MKNALLRRSCLLLCLLLFWLPRPAHAQVNLRILGLRIQKIEIKHIGPATVSDDLIRAHIRVKVGDVFTATTTTDDVPNLVKTGFVYNVQVLVGAELVEGGVKLIYEITDRPRLEEIKFEGNKKYSTSKLTKLVSSRVGDPFDEQKLFMDQLAIQRLYQEAGLQKTKVEHRKSITTDTGKASATFEITEAPKVLIKDVTFEGAVAYTPKKLASVIETKRRWFFSWLTGSGVLKDDMLDDDKEKLTAFYLNEGYIDFVLKEAKFEMTDAKRGVLRFVFTEGRQYKVGKVELKGNQLFKTEEILKGALAEGGRIRKPEMLTGKIFTPKGLTADKDAIHDFYSSKGYIDAQVIERQSPNVETGNIDLVYEIEELGKSFIEKIEIKGNVKTKDKVLRRELAVSPGEVFDFVRVDLSKQRLQNLDYFSKVDVAAESSANLVRNGKDLVITVDEKNTGTASFTAGFSSVESILGILEVTQGNFDLFKPPYFTGGGQKGRLRASYGARRQDYVATFIEPWFLERKLALGIEAYHRNTSFQSALYDEAATGARFSLERALGSDFLRGNVSYTIESVGILNVNPIASPELQGEAGRKLVSKIGSGITWDTRKGGYLPNGGQRTDLLAEIAGGPLGGQTDFIKLELKNAWYFPGFKEGHVIELGARGGAVQEYGSSTNVSLFNRYFLGGPRSLRGYKYAGVGPADSLGEPFGGRTYWTGSVEYSIPIIDRLRLAAFYDIGNVYSSAWSVNPNTSRGERLYNDDYGIGIRLHIPQLGPLRFDYGIPIHHDARSTGSGKFHFDVGFTRDF